MDGQGPYRQAGSAACPVCAAPLGPGDGLAGCPAGCGEWASAAVVDARWGDALDLDGDTRLRWTAAPAPLPCVGCGAPMMRGTHAVWGLHRCRAHGVWFAPAARASFEASQAEAIDAHVAHRARVHALAEVLRAAIAGDPAAAVAIATQLLELQRQVDRLQRTVDELRRTAARQG